jgi:hypothetical protein
VFHPSIGRLRLTDHHSQFLIVDSMHGLRRFEAHDLSFSDSSSDQEAAADRGEEAHGSVEYSKLDPHDVEFATGVSITRLRDYLRQRAPNLAITDDVSYLIAYAAVLRITNLMGSAWRLSKVRTQNASDPTSLPTLDFALLGAERAPAAEEDNDVYETDEWVRDFLNRSVETLPDGSTVARLGKPPPAGIGQLLPMVVREWGRISVHDVIGAMSADAFTDRSKLQTARGTRGPRHAKR